MKNAAVTLKKALSPADADMSALGAMLEEAFALTMEGCPDELKDFPLPKASDLSEGLQSGMDLWKIYADGELAGGALVSFRAPDAGCLELFFVAANAEGRGIGANAWSAVEKRYPGVKTWTTMTPCFQKRNIHFYVNTCGFHITAYHNRRNPFFEDGRPLDDEMFLFTKTLG